MILIGLPSNFSPTLSIILVSLQIYVHFLLTIAMDIFQNSFLYLPSDNCIQIRKTHLGILNETFDIVMGENLSITIMFQCFRANTGIWFRAYLCAKEQESCICLNSFLCFGIVVNTQVHDKLCVAMVHYLMLQNYQCRVVFNYQ